MRRRTKKTGVRIALMVGFLAAGVALGGCDLFWLVAPEIPIGIEASDGGHADRIVVAWDSVARATRYEVWRAETEDGTFAKVGESTATTFSDATATPNFMYWYRVKACNRGGCSELSAADSGHAAGEGISPVPTGVSATDGTYTDRVRVTWTASPGATSYEVWRGLTQGGVFNLDGVTSGTTYDDLDATPGMLYWYRVKACNALGCSAYSAANSGFTFATIPDPVANVTASDGTHSDRVRVTWPAVAGATSYEVQRADSEGGPYTLRATVPGASYDDTGVTVGTTYWYRVRPCNAAGCSAVSVPDAGFAQVGGGGGGGGGGGMPALPGQPGNVVATDGTHNDRIRVTWSSVSGATRYEVWRATTDTGVATQVAETTGTSFDDTAAVPLCERRWYEVRACNISGCGPFSVGDRGYRGGTLARVAWATTPVTVTYTGAGATVTLTWTAVPNATLYDVRYQVWRRSPIAAWALLHTTTAVGVVTYADAIVALGTTYHYRIRAVSMLGCIEPGTFSTEVQAVVACNPAAPTGTISATQSAGTVTVTWATVTGATNYQVFRSTTADGAYAYVGATAGNTGTFSHASGPGTFFYRVKTCVACGCGPLSTGTGSVTVTVPPPP
jgi:fibronectin type 3 domain-containing protein